MPRPLLVIGLAALTLVAACGPVLRPANGPRTADDLLAALGVREQQLTTYRLAGKADLFGRTGRVQGTLYAFAHAPDRLRLELLSPFASTLAALTVEGGKLRLADHRSRRYWEGEATPCAVARLTQVALAPDAVTRVLVGGTPLLAGRSTLTWDVEGFYRVEIAEADRRQLLEATPGPHGPELRRSLLRDGSGTVWEIRYARWRPVTRSLNAPHEISIEMPREQAEVLVRWDEGGVEADVSLPPGAFTLDFPPEAVVEPLRCGATTAGVMR